MYETYCYSDTISILNSKHKKGEFHIMIFKNSIRLATLATFLFAFAGLAMGQGPAIDTSTTSELEMTATVQTAVQLNISTGTGGLTVSGTNASGLFSVDF